MVVAANTPPRPNTPNKDSSKDALRTFLRFTLNLLISNLKPNLGSTLFAYSWLKKEKMSSGKGTETVSESGLSKLLCWYQSDGFTHQYKYRLILF